MPNWTAYEYAISGGSATVVVLALFTAWQLLKALKAFFERLGGGPDV